MRVKIANRGNAAGLIDPQTKRSPFVDPTTKVVSDEADVPESSHWLRRVLRGEVTRIPETASQPTGSEPIAPLTTRS